MSAILFPKARSATGRFVPGVSGNPAGRPKGSRNTSTLLMEALREGQAEEILETAVAKAKAGDGPMLRCLVARLFPVPRHPGVELDVPEGREYDPRAVVESALRGLARGEITPEEAFLIARTLEKAAKVMGRRPAALAEATPADEGTPVNRPYSGAEQKAAVAPRAPAAGAEGAAPTPRPERVAPEKSLYLRRRENRRAAVDVEFAANRRDATATGSAEPRSRGQGSDAAGIAPVNRLYSVEEELREEPRCEAA